MINRRCTQIQLALVFTALSGACKKAPVPEQQTGTSAHGSAQSAGAVAVRAMEIALDPAAGPGFCLPASMAADGSITSEDRVVARFNGTQLTTSAGDVVFRIDGARVIVPWNEQKGGRIEADGAWVLGDRNDRFDVNASGVPSMRGEASRCRARGYDATQRATAIALYVAPMLLMAREMAARNGLLGSADAAAPSASPPSVAQFRVIHAMPGAAAAHVTFRWNGIDTPAWEDLAFGSRSGHYASQTGSRLYSIAPRGSAGDAARIVYGSTPELEANKQYTALFVNTMMGGRPTAQLVVEEDVAPAAAAEGNALVSFFNAWVGGGAVDVCATQAGSRVAEVVMERASEGSWGSPSGAGSEGHFAAIASAKLARIQLRAAADNACTGAVVGSAAVPEIASDRQYTVVLLGERSSRTGPQLLVCPRDLGECQTVAVRR